MYNNSTSDVGPVTSTPARGQDREEVSEDEESLVPADPQPPAVEVGSASCHPSTTSTAVRCETTHFLVIWPEPQHKDILSASL